MPKKLLRAAAVVYFVITGVWLLLGLLQATVSWILVNEEDTLTTFLIGVWNICVAHFCAAIAVGLVLETAWAKNWGLWSSVVSVPLILATGGINVFNFFLAFLELIIIVLLVAERLMTRPRPSREDDVLPSGKPSGWR